MIGLIHEFEQFDIDHTVTSTEAHFIYFIYLRVWLGHMVHTPGVGQITYFCKVFQMSCALYN